MSCRIKYYHRNAAIESFRLRDPAGWVSFKTVSEFKQYVSMYSC